MEYGLIGEKLGHSFSKEIHERISDYKYDLCEVPKKEINQFLIERNFKAINVTIPYKETVLPYLHYIDEKAKLIGCVNTIVNKDNLLYGYNTDYYGLASLINYNNIVIENKKVLILGTGGTSKTAYTVATDLHAKDIIFVSRNKKTNVITYEEAYELHSDAEVIINTTPVGMYPNVQNLVIDISKFNSLESVIDVIYNPLKTRLIVDALKRNLKACGGLYMLIGQAVCASNIFLGYNPSYKLERINEVYKELISKKQNIVLIGMPSSGKSTIAQILKDKLNKELAELDTLIEDVLKMPIKDYLSNETEQEFRDLESSIVFNTSLKNNLVISTGGGVIERENNIDMLKQNGIIIFIDRNLENLTPTDSRPLSNNLDKLKKIYNRRYPLYKKYADYVVENNGVIDDAINEILGRIL